MLRRVDDDLFRALDWELESGEDSDGRALLVEALEHKLAGDLDAALDAIDRALLQAELEVVADDAVLALALLTRGAVLVLLERSEEAHVVCAQVRELTKNGSGELAFLDGFARCLTAALLNARGQGAEPIELFRSVAAELCDSADPRFRGLATLAHACLIRLLLESRRVGDGLAEWRALLEVSRDDPAAEVQAKVARAGDVAARLLVKRRPSLARSVAETVITRYGSSADPDTRAAVAIALSSKVVACFRRGRLVSCWRANSALLEFLGTDPEPEVVEALREAWPKKAERLLRLARVGRN